MNKKIFLAGMVAMALVFGIALVGCDNPTNNTPSTKTQKLTFKGGAGENATELTLSRDVAASALASVGVGTWSYRITQKGVEISKGTVEVTDTELTFISSTPGIQPFVGKNNAENAEAAITFTEAIHTDSGGTVTIPDLEEVSPFEGSWKGWNGDGKTVKLWVFSGNTFTVIIEGTNNAKGTFDYTETTITIMATHQWENGSWVPWTYNFPPMAYTINESNLEIAGDGNGEPFVKQ
ncbi:MAG: hypothetical protein LBT01_00360 [Spirochaetaceae bacterium]|jgi:hypothetical protein|nr:hypothetical protein [Spirochaetaceae bacterium]